MPAAQAIEQSEQHDANSGGDYGIEEKAQGKHGHGTRKEHALGNGQHNLMEVEQHKNEPEAAYRMLGIDSRADGRGNITYTSFCDAIQANRIVVAQCVLHDADRRAEKHSANRVPAAHAEIDCDEQGQVDELRKAAILVKEGLQYKRKKTDEWNRSVIVFVYFNIGFRSHAGAQHRGHVNDGERSALRRLQALDSLRSVWGFLRFSLALTPAE
jgi:hypothetical protein